MLPIRIPPRAQQLFDLLNLKLPLSLLRHHNIARRQGLLPSISPLPRSPLATKGEHLGQPRPLLLLPSLQLLGSLHQQLFVTRQLFLVGFPLQQNLKDLRPDKPKHLLLHVPVQLVPRVRHALHRHLSQPDMHVVQILHRRRPFFHPIRHINRRRRNLKVVERLKLFRPLQHHPTPTLSSSLSTSSTPGTRTTPSFSISCS